MSQFINRDLLVDKFVNDSVIVNNKKGHVAAFYLNDIAYVQHHSANDMHDFPELMIMLLTGMKLCIVNEVSVGLCDAYQKAHKQVFVGLQSKPVSYLAFLLFDFAKQLCIENHILEPRIDDMTANAYDNHWWPVHNGAEVRLAYLDAVIQHLTKLLTITAK
jgi:hypothetical protein